MDEADYGNQNAEFYRQQALTGYFRRNGSTQREAQTQHPGDPCHGKPGRGSSGPIACLDCGDEIDPARIKANPAAVRCIDCQEKWERRR
jgi:hypothetical protein